MGATPNAANALNLRGSDTLEEVTKDALLAAGIAPDPVGITYVGGGSGAGENAMIAGTQQIAPMSRQLNSGVADPVKCTATAQQLLIGLDGIAIVAGNMRGGDSLEENGPSSGADDCSDSLSGAASSPPKTLAVPGCGVADGCTVPGQFTFATWKDVLAMVYGGQQNAVTTNNPQVFTAPTTNTACTYSIVQPNNETGGDAACPAGQVCFTNGRCGDPAVVGRRNPTRVNCASPVRQALVDNWGFLFSDTATTPANGGACRNGNCTRLRHAYRRDDLSGTTDSFVTLVGLVTIANPTKAFIAAGANSSEITDRQAVANPFCNAGDKPMNKGHSDYLDLDPIRRAVDHVRDPVSGTRFSLEQVAQNVPTLGGNNNDANCNTLVGGVPHKPDDHSSPRAPGVWPDPDPRRVVGSTTTDELLTNELGLRFDQSAALAAPYMVSTRLCNGLVLPVTIPANYANANQSYFEDITSPGTTVLCTPGVVAPTIPGPTLNSLCPNGKSQALNGGCDMPVALNPNGTIRTFNCLSDTLTPTLVPAQDNRVYNLHPVDEAGHYRLDNYINPNISTAAGGIAASRQARVVSAFFRMHVVRATNLNGSIPTRGTAGLAPASVCNTAISSTEQIGCLVKANSCTIGFAGREAADRYLDPITGLPTVPGPANFAARIEGVTASTINIQALTATPVPANLYPISRKLWLNSIVGFGAATVTAPQTALFTFMNTPASIDPIILNRHFVQVPAGVTRLQGCP